MTYIVSKKNPRSVPLVATALSSAMALATPVALGQGVQSSESKELPAVKVDADAVATFKTDEVSSPKFTQPLVDTPQTLVVIRQELFQQQAATTLSETLRNTPGITLLMGENGNTATGDSIFMRGFDTQGSIFVDGIRDLGTISRDTFNTEQVEVAKGPAGMDYGRGAASGYINMSSKKAHLLDATSVSVNGGSAEYKRATLDTNRVLGESAALRVNLLAQDNGVAGRDQVENEFAGIAGSLGLGLQTETRVFLNVLHVRQDNRPDGGVPTLGLEGYYNAAFDSRPSTNFPDGGPLAGVNPAPVDSSNFYGSSDDRDQVKANMVTVILEHDLAEGFTLHNSSRYGRSTQDYVLTGVLAGNFTQETADGIEAITDAAQWTVNRSRQGKDQTNQILTNQTNFTASFGSGSIRHDLTSGVEFIYESQHNKTLALPTGVTQVPANLYRPSTRDTFVNPVPNGQKIEGETTTAAVYVLDTLNLGEQWKLSAGLRAERFATKTDRVVAQAAADPQIIPEGTLLPQSAEVSDNLLSWKLGAVYKPLEQGSIYLSYATSQLPPGGANFALTTASTTLNANSPNLDPQKGENLELGTKWNLWNNRLAVTAAVFRSTNENEIATQPDGTAEAVGERRVDGLELGLVGLVTSGWQVSAGLSLLDPEITRGNRSTANNGATQTDGGAMQWTPEVSFTFWNSYEFANGLTLGGGVRYMDSVVSSSLTDPEARSRRSMLEVPDYWVVDAMASYRITPQISLQLNLYNLADEDYIERVNNAGARYYPGAPRMIKLGAMFEF